MKLPQAIPIDRRWLRSLILAIPLALIAPQAMAQARVVDIATDALDPSNLADTEPSIAVNPVNHREIVIVAFSEAWGPGTAAPIWKSRDGGVNWIKVRQLPQPTVPSPIPGAPAVALAGPGDQKIAFDAASFAANAEAMSRQ